MSETFEIHPLLPRPTGVRKDWMKRAIPISLHGDAVPVVRVGKPASESLECLSIQSLLASGRTLEVKLLLYSMFEHSKVKDVAGTTDSMDTVWRVLVWSLQSLFEGKHPSTNWQGEPHQEYSSEQLLSGQPLCSEAEPYFGVLWSIKGDLDWYLKGLGLRSYNANMPCEFCNVDRGGEAIWWPTNFAYDAPWKTAMPTATEWKNRAISRHYLFRAFSFISQHNLEADELHILHLGVSQYLLGSVLWLLVYKCLGGEPASNFDTIWGRIQSEYEADPCGTEYTSLSISAFTNPEKPYDSFPRLKGKGCEVKSLLNPLNRLWPKLQKRNSFHNTVGVCLSELACLQNIIDDYKADAFLPDAISQKLLSHTDKFLIAYSEAAHHCNLVAKLCLFNVAPKFHWLWHMSFRSRFMNPRRCACFIDEDFVKHMKQVAAKSVAGTRLHLVPRRVIAKYRWGLSMQSFG